MNPTWKVSGFMLRNNKSQHSSAPHVRMPLTYGTIEAVRMTKHMVGCRQNAYPITAVDPEQNKHHSCGHPVHVIDLRLNDQVNCDNGNEGQGKPSHS